MYVCVCLWRNHLWVTQRLWNRQSSLVSHEANWLLFTNMLLLCYLSSPPLLCSDADKQQQSIRVQIPSNATSTTKLTTFFFCQAIKVFFLLVLVHKQVKNKVLKALQRSFYGGGVFIFLSAVQGRKTQLSRVEALDGWFVYVCELCVMRGTFKFSGVICSHSYIQGVIKLLQIPATHTYIHIT